MVLSIIHESGHGITQQGEEHTFRQLINNTNEPVPKKTETIEEACAYTFNIMAHEHIKIDSIELISIYESYKLLHGYLSGNNEAHHEGMAFSLTAMDKFGSASKAFNYLIKNNYETVKKDLSPILAKWKKIKQIYSNIYTNALVKELQKLEDNINDAIKLYKEHAKEYNIYK